MRWVEKFQLSDVLQIFQSLYGLSYRRPDCQLAGRIVKILKGADHDRGKGGEQGTGETTLLTAGIVQCILFVGTRSGFSFSRGGYWFCEAK